MNLTKIKYKYKIIYNKNEGNKCLQYWIHLSPVYTT
jgi:hypothetical protein